MFCKIIQNNPTVLGCVGLVCCRRVAREGGSVDELNGSNLLTNFANSMQIPVLINCVEHKTFKQKKSVKREARKHPPPPTEPV